MPRARQGLIRVFWGKQAQKRAAPYVAAAQRALDASFPFYSGNGSSETGSELPQVTQPVSGRALH